MNKEGKKASTPVFSVVVPMYNVEDYIVQCLKSVIEQSYEKFEIICVDDGSIDRSVALAKSLDDPRIFIVQQQNMGLAAARNTGINASRGMFVALLDSDDYWHPEKLEQHYRHFCKNPCVGLSFSASEFVDERGKKLGIGQFPKVRNITAKDVYCRNPVGNGSAAVFRRQALRDIAFLRPKNDVIRTCYFDEIFRQSEDIECWLRLILDTSWLIEGIDKGLCYYRVNDSGLSSNTEKQLSAWERVSEKTMDRHPNFIDRYYPLARAYQLRYLSRRAIQSGEAKKAITLIREAITSDYRILIEEPLRTGLTLSCALLALLPETLFKRIYHWGMKHAGQLQLN